MLKATGDIDHSAEAGPMSGTGAGDALHALLGASRAALLRDLVTPFDAS